MDLRALASTLGPSQQRALCAPPHLDEDAEHREVVRDGGDGANHGRAKGKIQLGVIVIIRVNGLGLQAEGRECECV